LASDFAVLVQNGLAELSGRREDRITVDELERWLEGVLSRVLTAEERRELLRVLEDVSQSEPPTCSGVPKGWVPK